MPLSRRALLATGAVLLVAGPLLWWWLRPAQETTATPPALAVPAASVPAAPGDAASVPATAPATGDLAYSPLADELWSPRFDAAHDVVVLHRLIGQFTTTLRLSERPPLGDNADLAAALTGSNRRRLVVIPPGHPALRDGLLLDRWGTPFHLHARSADVIDVRSAGPDRVLFTTDDLTSP